MKEFNELEIISNVLALIKEPDAIVSITVSHGGQVAGLRLPEANKNSIKTMLKKIKDELKEAVKVEVEKL